jgi:hypothetical protein
MAIARVQSKTANTGGSTATSLNIVFDSTPTAGNIVVLAVATNSGNPTITPSNTYSWLSVQQILSANGTFLTVFVGKVFSSASATITVTMASATTIAIAGAEYSGVDVNLDREAGTTGTSTSPDTGATGTTSSANQLWFAGIAHRNTNGATFSSATGGFSIVGQDKTSVGTTADRSVCLLEQIASATGTPDAGATVSASGSWAAQVLTLKETSSGSSTVFVLDDE